MDTIQKASKIFSENFPVDTCFERAIFYSWACQLETCCKYCYMSTLPKEKRTKDKVRSTESLLAETVIAKAHGWDYGFLSGGIGVFNDDKIIDLLKQTNEILKEKIWINIGILSKEQIKKFKPYIKGIVGTVEVINKKLHDEICPSKPIKAVEKMFDDAKQEGADCAMTLIIGLGETIDDFGLLKKFIEKHDIKKIHIYGLNPQKGTVFEKAKPPSAEYQAEWIAKTRIAFPKMDIQCGIWTDRVRRIALLLNAGANSISKFPIMKKFGSEEAKEIEIQAKIAKRKFNGTLTKIREKECYDVLEKSNIKNKEKVKEKIQEYLTTMKKTR